MDMTLITIIVLVVVSLVLGLFFLGLVGTLRRKGRWGINLQLPRCPNCGQLIESQVRVPRNMRQAFWGGWTCPNCETEMDKWGNRLS